MPARGVELPDTGPIPASSNTYATVSPGTGNSQPSAANTERPDVVIYSPPRRTTTTVIVEKPKGGKPKDNNSIKVQNYAVFDVYKPSPGEKASWWYDRNKQKIPFVNFMEMLSDEVSRAEKRILIESAYHGGDKFKAFVGGYSAGLLKGSVLLPKTLADMGKSLAKGIKQGAESQDVISGWVGLEHGNPLKDKKEPTRGTSYEEKLEDELLIAGHAPGVYEAQKKLEKANELEPEALKLASEREELLKQYKWFEEMAPKASTNPFLAEMYNMEAEEFNRQVMEYNRRVQDLEARYKSLNVEGALKTIEDFNARMDDKTLRGALMVGEMIGSAVGTTATVNAIRLYDYHIGPVRTKTQRVVIRESNGVRLVEKTTRYRGIFAKRPIETKQVSFVVKDADDVLEGPISFSDDVANAVKAKGLFGERPYERGIKVTEDDAFIHIGLRDAREFTLDKKFTYDDVINRDIPTPELPSIINGRVLSPEEAGALNRIVRKATIASGKKWLKVGGSGNVVQGVYDPPLSTISTSVERGTNVESVKVDLGHIKVGPTFSPTAPSAVVAPPIVVGMQKVKTGVVGQVRAPTFRSLTLVGQRLKTKTSRQVKAGSRFKFAHDEAQDILPWESDLEAFLQEYRLRHRKKITPTDYQEIDDTVGPIDTTIPYTITGVTTGPVDVTSLDVKPTQVELQTQKVATMVAYVPPSPPTPPTPMIKPPKAPPLGARRTSKRRSTGVKSGSFVYTKWAKRYKSGFEGALLRMNRSLERIEASLSKFAPTKKRVRGRRK